MPHPLKMEEKPAPYLPLVYRGMMLLAAASFLIAVLTGIWRIAVTRGFALPSIPEWWPPHGHLLVGSFLGIVIMFERIIALRTPALTWVPYLYGISAILVHTNFTPIRILHFIALGGWLFHRVLAARKFHSWEKPAIEAAAYVTLSSILNFPGGFTAKPAAALGGLAFAVATILIERLEMALYLKSKTPKFLLVGLFSWLGLWNTAVWFDFPSIPMMGILTLLLIGAVARFDTSLRLRLQGSPLHSFLRVALRIAYVWIVLGAFFMMLWNYLPGAIVKDVVIHSIGLGFIFSMILGHAPLILPAALGWQPIQNPLWHLFFIFQAMTLLRIGGDFAVAGVVPIWSYTGWLTAIGHLIAFVLYMALTLRAAKPARASSAS